VNVSRVLRDVIGLHLDDIAHTQDTLLAAPTAHGQLPVQGAKYVAEHPHDVSPAHPK
jgi:hypothetical protein